MKYKFIEEVLINNQKNSIFNCDIHGNFRIQTSRIKNYDILCVQCRKELKLKEVVENKIKQIKELGPDIHHDKFDYSDIYYDYDIKKYIIKCKKHGEISVNYHDHITRKMQCKQCSLENKIRKSKKLEERSKKYKFKILSKDKNKVTIECPIHGILEVYQSGLNHGCPLCYSEKKKQTELENIKNELNNNIKNKSILKVINIYKGVTIDLWCKTHGMINGILASNFRRSNNCPKCSYTGTSTPELELSSIIPGAILNTKTVIPPYELDVYSKEHKFAIEYNGIMWHSFGKSKFSKFNTYELERKNKYKHLIKTEMAETKGVQLYHIFEDEWLKPSKKNIWVSMIKSKLNLSDRIYARNCSIKEISSKESASFIEQNHIQGKMNAKIRIGLFYENELVQVMTFRTPTQSKYKGIDNYELSRLCSKIGTNVTGGASKLLKYFERNYDPKIVVSYANRRWSTNSNSNVYKKLGFDYIGSTVINYFYFNSDKILKSRNAFQKHKLKDKLDVFDETLTETENMYNNDYRKIYDCGNLLFIKTYDKGKK